MTKKRMTIVSLDEAMKIKGKSRKDAPEGPALGKVFWKDAKVVYPETSKEQVTVRVDAEVLEWFKAHGRGYQTRMNAVLQSYYEAHKNEKAAPKR
jgi:uncharacterized protein (DUF4415 family)